MPERGASQGTLRDTNLRLVLRTVLGCHEPVSRAGVAIMTGLTRSTVSRLVDDLVAAGLLDELEPSRPAARGRPATPLVPGGRPAALGLQVNASYLAARVVDLRGRVVAGELVRADLGGSDPGATLARLGALASAVRRRVAGQVRLVGCGLALPGLVDVHTGRVHAAPNLGWSEVRVRPLLGRRAVGGLGVRVGNEADLAARTVAETAPGRAGRYADFLYVSGEVGIGGAAVLGGKVFTGGHGWAGEIGHVTVDPRGPDCRCGSTGCLEQYAGRRAMLRAARLPDDATTADLLDRASAGNAAARRALDAAGRALGIALAGSVNVLDISTVVLGGDLAELAGPLLPTLREQLATRVLSARWRPPVVAVAPDDDAPGATGAAYAVLDGLLDDPARWAARGVGTRG